MLCYACSIDDAGQKGQHDHRFFDPVKKTVATSWHPISFQGTLELQCTSALAAIQINDLLMLLSLLLLEVAFCFSFLNWSCQMFSFPGNLFPWLRRNLRCLKLKFPTSTPPYVEYPRRTLDTLPWMMAMARVWRLRFDRSMIELTERKTQKRALPNASAMFADLVSDLEVSLEPVTWNRCKRSHIRCWFSNYW